MRSILPARQVTAVSLWCNLELVHITMIGVSAMIGARVLVLAGLAAEQAGLGRCWPSF